WGEAKGTRASHTVDGASSAAASATSVSSGWVRVKSRPRLNRPPVISAGGWSELHGGPAASVIRLIGVLSGRFTAGYLACVSDLRMTWARRPHPGGGSPARA